ncbi:hypothetical protein AHF37_04832 [Paragonimus kellicotti]|nr:hypothetical protein AHF37_04832 [Paragonimus kellicotti]
MNEQSLWYLKYAPKAIGIFTSALCLACGIASLISISVGCIIAGVLLIIISVVVMTLEAPFCCAMIPQLHKVSEFTENRSALQRVIFYAICTILPVCMCFGLSTIFAALALGGSCAFHIWMLVRDRRAQRQSGGTGGVVIGTGPPSTMTTTELGHSQSAHSGYGDSAGFQGQLLEKATVGAVRGVMSSGGGGYPGAPGGTNYAAH